MSRNPFDAYVRLCERLLDQTDDTDLPDGQARWSFVLFLTMVLATIVAIGTALVVAWTTAVWLGLVVTCALVGGFVWTAYRHAFPAKDVPESDDVKETYGREDAK